MMNVSGVNVQVDQTNQMGMGKKTDPISKNIQTQISNAQKRLEELSANKEMSMEEKMEKRKEIQEQIHDLNKQLRQYEFEQRKEKQQKKSTNKDMPSSKSAEKSNNRKQKTGLSQASMTAMISADSAKEQAQSLGNVVTQLEGRKSVLGAEIEQDARRGRDVTKKQGEFEDLEERIVNAENSQIHMLTKAKEEMEEAEKSDQQAKETENAAKKKINEEKNTKEVKKEKNASIDFSEINGEMEKSSDIPVGIYTPIDIRL